jgi:putative addiction module CopG family antidote
MEIALTAQLTKFVDEKVKEGRYENASEVVREALRRFEIREKGAAIGADADIEGLAFLVLMEAAKSAQEDVRAIMASVKAINAAKRALRELLGKVNRDAAANASKRASDGPLDFSKGLGSEAAYHKVPFPVADAQVKGGVSFAVTDLWPGTITKKEEIDALVDQMKYDLDSMSEMGETESLRLQMAMDRMSKMMSTLSNALKKISDTSSAIVQNLK